MEPDFLKNQVAYGPAVISVPSSDAARKRRGSKVMCPPLLTPGGLTPAPPTV